MDTPNSTTRACCTCHQEFPATDEFFHHSKRDALGLSRRCKTCACDISKQWRRNNPIRNYENKKRWRLDNPERVSEYHKRWRLDNPERIAEHNHKKKKKRRKNNPEIVRAQDRKHKNVRRALKHNSGGTYTHEQIQKQYERQNGRCYYAACGHAKLGDKYHIEHVIPLSRGGSNDISNIVLTCPRCNLSKSTKLPHEWPEGGRLL